MPTVPLPASSVQVRPGGRFTADRVVPARDLSGGQIQQFGQALTQAGAGIASMAQEAQNHRDVSAIKRSQALFEEDIVTADTGFMATIGEATGRTHEDTWKALTERGAEIEDGMEPGAQQRLFRENTNRRLLAVRSRWGTHAARQLKVELDGAGVAALEAKIEAGRMMGPYSLVGAPGTSGLSEGAQPEIGPGAPLDGAQGPLNEPQGVTQVRSAQAEARSLAAGRGWGPEKTEAFARKASSAMHDGYIRDLLTDGQTTEARDHLKRVPVAEMDADTRRTLKGVLKRASAQDASTHLALKIQDLAHGQDFTPSTPLRITEQGPVDARSLAFPAGTTRDAHVSATELEAFTKQHLDQLFKAGEIDAELRDLTMSRNRGESARRQREAVAHENETMDLVEAWGFANPDRGFADLPPPLLADVADVGRLREAADFLETHRAVNNSEVVGDFFSKTPQELRAKQPADWYARLRFKMDEPTLKLALAAVKNAHEPGEGMDAGKITRVVREYAAQMGVQDSPRELRHQALHGVQSNQDIFGDVFGTPDSGEKRLMGKLMMELTPMLDGLTAGGVNLSQEIIVKALDQITSVQSFNSFDGFDDIGVPRFAATREQVEDGFVTLHNQRVVNMSDITGTTRGIPGSNLFAGEGTKGAIGELLLAARTAAIMDGLLPLDSMGDPVTEFEIASWWDQHGDPNGGDEVLVALNAATAVADRGDRIIRHAARQALRKHRGENVFLNTEDFEGEQFGFTETDR